MRTGDLEKLGVTLGVESGSSLLKEGGSFRRP
jgi:hypothetical protein